MNYSLYTVEDLLTDESFINYCLEESPNSITFWNTLRNEDPVLAERMDQARMLLYTLSVKIDDAEKQAELMKLRSVIEHSERETDAQADDFDRSLRLRTRLKWWSAVAAILLCITSYSLLSRKDYSTSVPIYAQLDQLPSYKTGFNERRSVTLPDGSVVLMNGAAELKVDPKFNQNNRVLWLNGEAHFSVAKNKDKPFIVISGKTATTALGTSFKINNYHNNPETSVMLTTGKVSVGFVKGAEVINHMELLPGERADAESGQEKYIKSKFDIKEVDDWNNRKIVFSMSTLKEIKNVLKGIYGIEISARNQPKKPIAFTGQFNNETLTQVLDAIGFSNHFTYTLKNDHVMLEFEE